MCSGTEAGSYLKRIDSCITQLQAQGPSRTCNESKEKEVQGTDRMMVPSAAGVDGLAARTEMCSGSETGLYSRRIDFVYHSTLGLRVIKKKKDGPHDGAEGRLHLGREAGPPNHHDDKVDSDQ